MTLLDLQKLNGHDRVTGLIEENLNSAPEVTTIPVRTIAGTQYKTIARTGLPSTGFRKANDGRDTSKSKFTERLVECFILDSPIEMDKAVADAHEDGPDALMALEASGVMQSSMLTIGSQTIYGTDAGSDGFTGLQDFVDALGSVKVNATGSTANTGSSVYLIRAGAQGVQYVYGRNSPFVMSPTRIERITGQNGKKLDGYVSGLSAWVGLQCVNKNAIARIYNLTAQSGKGLTDALILQAIAESPRAAGFTHILMSSRSALQLALSRDANARPGSNTPIVEQLPTSAANLPIIITDSILNTEAIV
jgi:hypothetical protein